MGVVKRFISQLSYGQDLTRIAFPSEFLNPYSILELAGVRYLSRFESLMIANTQAEPAQRMLHTVHYYLATLFQSKMYRKPYNPVVGESHYCFSEQRGSNTQFIAEQVTHHPPVSAFHINNDKDSIEVEGIISFGVKFHMNSVTVGTAGNLRVSLHRHHEDYIFNKSIPDLLIKNVVLGTRQTKWQKTVEVECKQSGCKCKITFTDSGSSEKIEGVITKDGKTQLKFEGSLDDEIYYFAETDEEETLFISEEQIPNAKVIYPVQLDPYPSMKVWRQVTKCIMANNMTGADAAKREVEEEQRTRVKAGEDDKKERKYFIYNNDLKTWVYKPGTFSLPPS
eukprot:TRINITY_DN3182_c1_g1_i3.p1 TRINITY_DN3182_c1_g1~~TRINITY_DN3182_c1_g1_i3.p1  ORF type:complete len:338 (-),score=77.66 TRINITY_DN3182_c1_g1_i3:227-1240(-)